MEKFQKKYATYNNKNKTTTHISMGEHKIPFTVDANNEEEFYKLYKEGKYYIAEQQNEYSCIVADFDIEDANTSKEVLYTKRDVKAIIKSYYEKFREIFVNIKDEDLTCILLTKPPRIKNNILKHGFHLHFPFIICKKLIQKVHIFPDISKKHPLLDPASCNKTPWLMYGSAKCKKSGYYKIDKVYDYRCKKLKIKDIFANKKITNIKGLEWDKPPMSRLLSLRYLDYPVKNLKKNAISPIIRKIRCSNTVPKKVDSKLIEDLIGLIDNKRSNDYKCWKSFGLSIYNESNGSEEGLYLWILFSKKCKSKFDLLRCEDEWERFANSNTNYSIGTIKYYAKTDSPDKYEKLMMSRLKKNCCTMTFEDYNIAKNIIYEKWGELFKCVNIKKKEWYIYKNGTWSFDEQGTTLYKLISEELPNIFRKFRSEITMKLAIEEQDDIREKYEKQLKKINFMISCFCESKYKPGLLKECSHIFYDKNFIDKLDKNKYLIAFKNGTYDLKEFKLRDGEPTDYLSFKLPINYKKCDSVDMVKIDRFFETLFPNKDYKKYMLNFLSTMYVGGNMNKIALFLTGSGGNGKSQFIKLLTKMLGMYYKKIELSSFVVGKRQAGSTNAGLSRMSGGTRVVIIDEANKTDKDNTVINSTILKLYTGNDDLICRDLYQKGSEMKEFTPMFKIIFVANDLPDINGVDQATIDRVRVVKFESKFVSNAPKSYEKQLAKKTFTRIKDLDKFFNEIKEPLTYYLIEKIYKNIHDKPEWVPDIVAKESKKYMDINNTTITFYDEIIQKDPNSKLSVSAITKEYNKFLKETGCRKHITQKECIKRLEFIMGVPKKRSYEGYSFKDCGEDIDY